MANLQVGTKNPMKNEEVIMIYVKATIFGTMEVASLDTTPPKLEIHIIHTTSTMDDRCSEKKVCTQKNKKIVTYMCSIHFACMLVQDRAQAIQAYRKHVRTVFPIRQMMATIFFEHVISNTCAYC